MSGVDVRGGRCPVTGELGHVITERVVRPAYPSIHPWMPPRIHHGLLFLFRFTGFASQNYTPSLTLFTRAKLCQRGYTSYGPVPVCACLSVCLSVTSWCSIEVVGRIELVFGVETSFHQSKFVNTHCVLRKLRYQQK